MKNIFTQHPNENGETYFEHLQFVLVVSSYNLIISVMFIIHGIFPFMFKHTGGNFLFKVIHRFITRMPKVDDRVTSLAKCIESKLSKSQ